MEKKKDAFNVGVDADVMRWRCEGCNRVLEDAEVEPYGDGYCHRIRRYSNDWEPEPCGPVIKESV